MPVFGQLFDYLCAQPRAQTTGLWLLQSDLIRVHGGPQGPGRCDRCFGPSEWGTAILSTYNGAVLGPCLSWFGPFDCSATGRSFVAVAGPNRPETEPRRPLSLETSCPVTADIKSTPYLGRSIFHHICAICSPGFRNSPLLAAGAIKKCSELST